MRMVYHMKVMGDMSIFSVKPSIELASFGFRFHPAFAAVLSSRG
nr:hypothetical protein Iba_chr12fCG2370 [Ipomoea batatas]